MRVNAAEHNITYRLSCDQQKLRSACTATQSIQSLSGTLWVAKVPTFLHAEAKTDQTLGRQANLSLCCMNRSFCRFAVPS